MPDSEIRRRQTISRKYLVDLDAQVKTIDSKSLIEIMSFEMIIITLIIITLIIITLNFVFRMANIRCDGGSALKLNPQWPSG